ncbi:MAG: prohibitin family protein [Rhodospirillaceae bacterium]
MSTVTSGLEDKPKARSGFAVLSRWLENRADEGTRGILIFVMMAMLGFLYFLPSIVIFVPAGHGGVLWKRFANGTQLGPALGEGAHIIFPWDKIEIYDLRIQQDTRPYTAIANDGLPVTVEITSRFRPIADSLAELHKHVGPSYINVLLAPEIDSVAREIISRYKADELYAQRRQKIQSETYEQVADRMSHVRYVGTERGAVVTPAAVTGYIMVQDILVRNVALPEEVVAAIERKINQDQLAQEYQFRLQREQSESSRKQIEAEGIRTYQETVRSSLTENFLRWRSIEATLALAQSPNSKVVVVGNAGTGGLPLILDVGSDRTLPAPGLETPRGTGAPASGQAPASAPPPASPPARTGAVGSAPPAEPPTTTASSALPGGLGRPAISAPALGPPGAGPVDINQLNKIPFALDSLRKTKEK